MTNSLAWEGPACEVTPGCRVVWAKSVVSRFWTFGRYTPPPPRASERATPWNSRCPACLGYVFVYSFVGERLVAVFRRRNKAYRGAASGPRYLAILVDFLDMGIFYFFVDFFSCFQCDRRALKRRRLSAAGCVQIEYCRVNPSLLRLVAFCLSRGSIARCV